jgi:hypothetical protein
VSFSSDRRALSLGFIVPPRTPLGVATLAPSTTTSTAPGSTAAEEEHEGEDEVHEEEDEDADRADDAEEYEGEEEKVEPGSVAFSVTRYWPSEFSWLANATHELACRGECPSSIESASTGEAVGGAGGE